MAERSPEIRHEELLNLVRKMAQEVALSRSEMIEMRHYLWHMMRKQGCPLEWGEGCDFPPIGG